jgi:hypothetical protein
VTPHFETLEKETQYGRGLIFEIVNAAKAGRPYKKLIKEVWDIAERNEEVWKLVEHLILSLHKRNSA